MRSLIRNASAGYRAYGLARTGFSPATFRRNLPLRRLGRQLNPFPLIQLPYHRLVNPWTLGAVLHEVSHNLQNDLGLNFLDSQGRARCDGVDSFSPASQTPRQQPPSRNDLRRHATGQRQQPRRRTRMRELPRADSRFESPRRSPVPPVTGARQCATDYRPWSPRCS